jgi:RND family efflux transporter MFP subunit
MKPSRTILSLLTVFLILLVVGGAVAWKLLTEEESTTARPQLPDTEGVEVASASQFAGAVVVEGTEVVRDTLWIHVVASGQAEAYRRSTVATRAAGIVMEVRVRENQRVEAGELLVRLDTLEAALDLAQARAGMVQAQADYQERMLFGGDVLLDEEVRRERERIIRAASGLDQAEVALRRAELGMANTEVRAPFAGRVADLAAVEGAFLGNGAEVLTLVQISPIRVEVNVGEADISFLDAGRSARIRFSSFPGESFTGRVESVNPVVDPDSRSARVTLVLPNADERLRPGMWAQASLDARSYPDRVLIPREAVVERDRRPVVFLANNVDAEGNGISEWRYVTPGFRNETHVEILEDAETATLRPGEIVLVDGHHTLAHQVPVRLVENVAVAGGRPGR